MYKISKDLSARYYNNNKRLQKKACERCQSLTKEENVSNYMVVNDTKKYTRRWKAKACWVWKKYNQMRKNALLLL